MIRVTSEIGKLQKVIIHTPDDGIEQVTPDKAVEYLYEDIVYLDKMRKEHNILRLLLEQFIGKENVLDIQELLTEVCLNEKVRMQLIMAVAKFEENPALVSELTKMRPQNLAYTLITGVTKKSKKVLFPPASNYIFCRDIGVVINNHLLINQANKRARSRESLLSWFVYHFTQTFEVIHRNNWFIKVSSDLDDFIENIIKPENEFSVEGGDVMMFGNDHLLIGCSERTSRHSFEKIKEIVFKKQIVKHIVMVEIPKERYCMHLDTIFTRINTNVCVVYEPLIMRKGKITIKRFEKGIEEPFVYDSLSNLLTEINPNMNFIPCGGGITPHQEREQWTDGCNLFAIKPGVAVTYDRNKMTTKAIEKAGYKVVKAENLIKKLKSGEVTPDSVQKTLILIPSNELSRARGGTHCLTFPILRES